MYRKILLVEDEKIPALKTAKTIQKHGFEVKTADTGEKAVDIIEEDPEISLILMDIDLGEGMDGTETARIILAKHTLPVVFLTSHSEKEYVDKVKQITRYGYVLKNSGEFILIESINMAFELFEAHKEVQEKEERYEALFYNSHSPMMLIQPENGKIIDVNLAACNYYGWSRHEMTNMLIQDINQLTEKEILQEMEKARTEKRSTFVFRHALADGSVRDVEVRSSPIAVSGQKLLYSIINDITEKKHSEDRFRFIVDNLPDPLFIQANMEFRYLNPAALHLFGITSQAELVNTPVLDRFRPDYRTAFITEISKLIDKQEQVIDKMEIEAVRVDGSSVWIEATVLPIEYNGEQGLLVSARNFSERRQREDKLQEMANIGSWELDLSKNTLFWSNEIYRIFGLEPQEFEATYEAFLETIHPDDRSRVHRAYTESVGKNKDDYEIEHRIIRKHSGEVRFVHEKCENIKDQNGAILRSVGMVQDITALKEKEYELQQSKEKYKQLVNNSPTLIMEFDLDTNEIISCNPAMADFLQVPVSELVGTDAGTHFSEDTFRERKQHAKRAIKKDCPQVFEDTSRGRYFYNTLIPIIHETRRILQLNSLDITERRHAEALQEKQMAELQKYRDRLEATMQIGNIAWWEMDMDTGKVIFNEQKSHLLGYFAADFKTYHDFTNLLHPDDYERSMQAMRDCLSGSAPVYDVDYRLKTKSGDYRWFHDIGGITNRDSRGKPQKVTGVVIDINDRKEDEKKIKESMEKNNFLMRELNHRIKNNLNMITSLVSLKEFEIDEDLSDIKNQMNAIRYIHDQLNKTDSVDLINVKEYMQSLLENVFSTFYEQKVTILNNIETNKIPTQKAIPMGLLVNEIATNAIKHGFTSNKEARFEISLQKSGEENQYELTLANSGEPFPEEIELDNPDSLGLKLINTLVRQLSGTVHLRKHPEPAYSIRFPI